MAVKNYLINDKWLDIDKQNIVEVKSTDGVIGSVKLNGEEYGGGGGSSDFSTAEVTVVNNYNNEFMIHVSSAMDNDEMHSSVPDINSATIGDRTILRIILYKGNAIMRISGFPLGAEPSITTSGNIQYIEIANIYTITGDCAITIS